jgi:very-short-patch-repair endonuclease
MNHVWGVEAAKLSPMADYFDGWFRPTEVNPLPPVASMRTLTAAICDALIQRYTRAALASVLPEELRLEWRRDGAGPDQAETKRDLIAGYIEDWPLAQLASLARRLSTYADIYQLNQEQLASLVNAYEQGDGVQGRTKNLIFASPGPKPDLVLRDAVSNDIEVVANGDTCLIYDQPLPDGGLKFSDLVAWWAAHPSCPSDLDVPGIARHLYQRLAASLESPPELLLFRTYYARFKDDPHVIALVPQVYLHYDPLDQRTRRASVNGAPLARQRMDFLMLFSDRKRVVIEVDGKQHYAVGDTAAPRLYSEMVAEDRRLKLAGYQVFRFGGYELGQPGAEAILNEFFDEVHSRMS